MSNEFVNFPDRPEGPSRSPYNIVPSNTQKLAKVPKGIYVGGGGNVTLRGVEGTEDVTYYNLADGSYIEVAAEYVRETGTTATNLIAEA